MSTIKIYESKFEVSAFVPQPGKFPFYGIEVANSVINDNNPLIYASKKTGIKIFNQ